MSLERQFSDACLKGNLSEVQRLVPLKVDFNCQDYAYGNTGFYCACSESRLPVVEYLLSIKEIDLNLGVDGRHTPLMIACFWGHDKVVELLLRQHDRVDVNKATRSGVTALYDACAQGNEKAAKMLLATGRVVVSGTTVAERARECGNVRCAEIVESYIKNPVETAKELRNELGWVTQEAEILASIIFLSDGLLGIEKRRENSKAARFFAMASRLPFELQMLVANTASGRADPLVPFCDRERGFRRLAKIFS